MEKIKFKRTSALIPTSLQPLIEEKDDNFHLSNSSGDTLVDNSTEMSNSSKSNEKRQSKPSFTDLYTAEFRRNAKYHTSDRTLLVLLEEERNKYLQLEMQYHKVLQEVETLQNNHLSDARATEKAHESEARNFQKALVLKSEECGSAQKELSHWQAKYAKDSSSWLSTNEKLESHLARAQKALRDFEIKLRDKEAAVSDLKREKQALLDRTLAQEQQVVEQAARREKELLERMGSMERELKERLLKRDEELRKSILIAKEKDIAFHDEKEKRMKLEVDSMQTNHALKQRGDELKLLKSALARKQEELEQFAALKAQFSEAKRDIAQLKSRETRSLDEVASLKQRETTLVSKLEELHNVLRKQTNDSERLADEQNATRAELEQARIAELKTRNELQGALKTIAEQEAQLESAQKKSRAQNSSISNLTRELDTVTGALGDAKAGIADLVERFNGKEAQLKAQREQALSAESQYRLDRENLVAQIGSQQNQLLEAQNQAGKLRQQLADEISQHSDLQVRNKETLLIVQDKISQLQQALQAAQVQLSELRDTETGLRTLLRQRDDTVSQQAAKIAQIASVYEREQTENEQFRLRKQDEWIQVNEKFAQAKSIFENELSTLRQSLQSRQHQVESLTEELGRINQHLNQASQQKFRAENKVAELAAQEQGQARLIETLQQQIQSKSSENAVLALKLQSLGEQTRRFEEEIFMHRQSAAQKDKELNSLQGNVTELTRRLKSQVDILMGSDAQPSSRPYQPSPLPTLSYVSATPRRQPSQPYVLSPTANAADSSFFNKDSNGASAPLHSSPSNRSARSKSTQLVIDGIAEELSKLGIPNFSNVPNASFQNLSSDSSILQAINGKAGATPNFQYEELNH